MGKAHDTGTKHVPYNYDQCGRYERFLGIFSIVTEGTVGHPTIPWKKSFGLSPRHRTKQQRNYRSTDYQKQQSAWGPLPKDEVLFAGLCSAESSKNTKVRSFGELAKLVKPYHIEIRQNKKHIGKDRVAYGPGTNQKATGEPGFTQTASTVAPEAWAAPKLQKVFEANSKIPSYFPMQPQTFAWKQIETT